MKKSVSIIVSFLVLFSMNLSAEIKELSKKDFASKMSEWKVSEIESDSNYVKTKNIPEICKKDIVKKAIRWALNCPNCDIMDQHILVDMKNLRNVYFSPVGTADSNIAKCRIDKKVFVKNITKILIVAPDSNGAGGKVIFMDKDAAGLDMPLTLMYDKGSKIWSIKGSNGVAFTLNNPGEYLGVYNDIESGSYKITEDNICKTVSYSGHGGQANYDCKAEVVYSKNKKGVSTLFVKGQASGVNANFMFADPSNVRIVPFDISAEQLKNLKTVWNKNIN